MPSPRRNRPFVLIPLVRSVSSCSVNVAWRERVAEDRAPEPRAVAPEGAAELGSHLAHAFGLVAEERPALELRGEVVGLQAGPGAAQVSASRAPSLGRAQGQLDLNTWSAHAHVRGCGSGHEAGERVQVGVKESRAQGAAGSVTSMPSTDHVAPGSGVAVGDEERLLLAVRPPDVHPVHHDPRHIAQDRPGIGGPRARPSLPGRALGVGQRRRP